MDGAVVGATFDAAGRGCDACGTGCRWGWFWTSTSGWGLASSSRGQPCLMFEGSCLLLNCSLRWLRLDISSTSTLLGRNRMSGCGEGVPHLTEVGWALDVRCRPLDHLCLVVCLPLRCDGEVFGHRWCLWGNLIWRSPYPYCWDFRWCYCLRCEVADPS